MQETEIRQRLGYLAPGDAISVDLADIAAIPPQISDDDEYAFAESLRERVRNLCSEYGVYSLELDQDGPVEDPVDFRKVTVPPLP